MAGPPCAKLEAVAEAKEFGRRRGCSGGDLEEDEQELVACSRARILSRTGDEEEVVAFILKYCLFRRKSCAFVTALFV